MVEIADEEVMDETHVYFQSIVLENLNFSGKQSQSYFTKSLICFN